MIVICEECGKKYRIDPDKIKGSQARFNCNACSHLITVQKPQDESSMPAPNVTMPERTAPQTEAKPKKARKKKEKAKKKKYSLGVRGKMIILFFIVPVILSGMAALLSMRQVEETADEIVQQSGESLFNFAELIVLNDSKIMVSRIKEFLDNNPSVTNEDLNTTPELKTIVSQANLWGGYVAIYALPDDSGAWKIWLHPEEKIIGADMRDLKKRLGSYYPEFLKIYAGVKRKSMTKGKYLWKEANGKTSEKYMVCRVIPGTQYVVASTVFLEQISSTVQQSGSVAQDRVYFARYINIGIMVVAFLFIGTIVTVFGHKLTGSIKYLTNVADRISVGDLETEIVIKSKDELSDLAEAISRMQDSLRLSIERLRRRR